MKQRYRTLRYNYDPATNSYHIWLYQKDKRILTLDVELNFDPPKIFKNGIRVK
jgi:hypothetical protein